MMSLDKIKNVLNSAKDETARIVIKAGGKTHGFNRGMKARFSCFSFTFAI